MKEIKEMNVENVSSPTELEQKVKYENEYQADQAIDNTTDISSVDELVDFALKKVPSESNDSVDQSHALHVGSSISSVEDLVELALENDDLESIHSIDNSHALEVGTNIRKVQDLVDLANKENKK